MQVEAKVVKYVDIVIRGLEFGDTVIGTGKIVNMILIQEKMWICHSQRMIQSSFLQKIKIKNSI